MAGVKPSDDGRSLLAPDYRAKATPEDQLYVSSWFYSSENDVLKIPRAAFIWWSNVVCACFHLLLAITTVVVAMSGGKGMDTPKLTVFLTNLSWQMNSTDALTPTNVPQEGLALAHMTMWFFLLSFFAHATIAIGNYTQAFALNNEKNRKVTRFTGWYFVWIRECRQPLRWFECASPTRPHTSPS